MAEPVIRNNLEENPPEDWLHNFPERHHQRITLSYHKFVNLYQRTFPISCSGGLGCDGKTCGLGFQACTIGSNGKMRKTRAWLCSSRNLLRQEDKETGLVTWNYDVIAYWNWKENSHINNPLLLAPSSEKFFFFSCPKSDCDCHVYESVLNNFIRGSRCPFCVGKKICSHNNAAVRLPEVFEWWNSDKNLVTPYEIAPFSQEKRWFRCPNASCECHIFRMTMSNFASGFRCPFCAGRKVCPHYNAVTEIPDIIEWWDFPKNSIGPHQILPGSCEKFWFRCPQDHSFKSIMNQFRMGSRCRKCYDSNRPRISLQYIQEYSRTTGISLQNAESEKGQFKIPETGRYVHGYNAEQKLVVLFYSCFQYGCPRCYSDCEPRKIIYGKSFEELYQRTLAREEELRRYGYRVESIWGCEYHLNLSTQTRDDEETEREEQSIISTIDWKEDLFPFDDPDQIDE